MILSHSQSKLVPLLSSSKPSQVAIVDFSTQSAALSNHTHHPIPPAMKSINGYRADPNSPDSSPFHPDKPPQSTTESSGPRKLPVKECIFTFNHTECSSSTADNKTKHYSRPSPKRVAIVSRRNSLSTGQGMKTTSSNHLPPLKSTSLVNSSCLKKVSFGSETLRVSSAKLHNAGNSQEVIISQQKRKSGSKGRKNSLSVIPSTGE